jgi:hypothetical protein
LHILEFDFAFTSRKGEGQAATSQRGAGRHIDAGANSVSAFRRLFNLTWYQNMGIGVGEHWKNAYFTTQAKSRQRICQRQAYVRFGDAQDSRDTTIDVVDLTKPTNHLYPQKRPNGFL